MSDAPTKPAPAEAYTPPDDALHAEDHPVPETYKRGIVLSGGGAKGGYEVGVMKALFEGVSPSTEHRPLDGVEVYTGTSVGSYNAAFMAADSGGSGLGTVGQLETVWRTRIANTRTSCGNGVYRVRGAPFQFLDPGCLLHPAANLSALAKDAAFFGRLFAVEAAQFATSDQSLTNRILQSINLEAAISPAPLRSLVHDTIDFDALRRNTKALSVIASNWALGVAQHFDKREIASELREKAILASAAIPGFFPPVTIHDTPFVDGGVTMNTPLRPAIRDGASELHVIYVDPLVRNIPFPEVPSTLDTLYRFYVVTIASRMGGDIGVVAAINEALQMLRHLAVDDIPESLVSSPVGGPISRVIRRQRAGRPYRPITIHRHRPTDELGGAEGLLDFSEDAIERNISQGYKDTLSHDCRASGCVVVPQAA